MGRGLVLQMEKVEFRGKLEGRVQTDLSRRSNRNTPSAPYNKYKKMPTIKAGPLRTSSPPAAAAAADGGAVEADADAVPDAAASASARSTKTAKERRKLRRDLL